MKLSTFISHARANYKAEYLQSAEYQESIGNKKEDAEVYVCNSVGRMANRMIIKTDNIKLRYRYHDLKIELKERIAKIIFQECTVRNYLSRLNSKEPSPIEMHEFRLQMLENLYQAAKYEEKRG